jgi:hypothetical protein
MRRATLVIGVALLATFVIGPVIVWLLHSRTWLEGHLKVTAGAGTGTLLLALVVQLGAASGATETPAGKVTGAARKLGSKLVPLLAKFAGAVVGPLLMLAVTLSFAVHGAVHGWSPGQVMLALALLGPLLLIGGGADLNAWSLHPYYKERLLSAYAVDPRVPSPTTPLPQPVDGPLPPFIRATASQSDDPGDALRSADGLPELVICAAANLTDDSITAPGRRVVSWVFNDQAIGSRAIAGVSGGEGHYRPDDMPERYKDLASTWTAVAVSGAAFAPAMGKMTRPERTLFALGNLRLGVWYPNPRYMATTASEADRGRFDKAWYDRHHPRPWYLVKEALGLHKLNDPWVYVTDGGHYENLGLVELLRRRCTEIYCFDAAGDQTSTFGTLADAMRIARAELGVEIKIDTRPLQSDEKGMSKAGVGVGTVHYPPVTAGGRPLVGWIVIAKLTVPEKAPFDIIDLARTLRSFPTHPTSDQLYTDQKFEAYRALGAHLSAQAVELGGRIRRLTTRPGGESSRDVPTAVALMQGSLDPPGDDEPDDTDEAPAFDS